MSREKVREATNIRRMMARIMCIVFLAIACSLGMLMYFQTKSMAVEEAEKKIKNLLLEHQALHAYISKYQKPAITNLKQEGKLYKEYFSPELLSSSFITRYMHDLYNDQRKKNELSDSIISWQQPTRGIRRTRAMNSSVI